MFITHRTNKGLMRGNPCKKTGSMIDRLNVKFFIGQINAESVLKVKYSSVLGQIWIWTIRIYRHMFVPFLFFGEKHDEFPCLWIFQNFKLFQRVMYPFDPRQFTIPTVINLWKWISTPR
jgi:hypothetical protein